MARKNVTLTILFADIANSTHLYETLGNEDARNLIGDCISLLSKVTLNHRGTVVKTIGDEIMCTFPTATDAVEAAMDMNLRLMDMPVDNLPGTFPPNIYVGIQEGPVIVDDDKDVFGDAVNVAAYLVESAKQRQIITTEETLEVLKPELKRAARHIDKTIIKGKAGEIDIYEIVWEQKDETIMMDIPLDALIDDCIMELKLADQIVDVGKDCSRITLGRQRHNDLVVDDIRVSRTHARIEYRRGKFILVDQSTNGTYFEGREGSNIHLRRDEIPLSGSGVISLGREIISDSAEAISLIHYEIKA
jgi:class 3 adenylate cyclase